MACRDDFCATACGNGDRDSRKSHTGGNKTARTYGDGVVLYSASGRAGSAKIITCSSPLLSPETPHFLEVDKRRYRTCRYQDELLQ